MFSRSNITEANKHLAAMHERIISLENTVRHQNQTLIDNDALYQEKIQLLSMKKEEELQKLQQMATEQQGQVKTRDLTIQKLEEKLKEKDQEIQQLQIKVATLTKATQHLPSLRSLVSVLGSAELVNGQGDLLHEESPDHYATATSFDGDVSSMAKHFATNHRPRNFSISEDDAERDQVYDDIVENDSGYKSVNMSLDVGGETKDKEFYL